jgi:hypothetical protein
MKYNSNFFCLFFLSLCIFSCRVQQKIYINIDATIIYGFEETDIGEKEKVYFLKSASCITDEGIYNLKLGKYTKLPVWHDLLLNSLNQNDEIFKQYAPNLRYKNKDEEYMNNPQYTPYYSKKRIEGYISSDYVYNYLFDETEPKIIFNIKADISLIKKIPKEAILLHNNRYACVVKLDTLNLPFFKIIDMKKASPTPKEWLSRNNYYKMPIDSFRVEICD